MDPDKYAVLLLAMTAMTIFALGFLAGATFEAVGRYSGAMP